MGNPIALNLTALYFLAALAAVGISFALAEIWLYRSAFRSLTPVDPEFRTPSTLALLAVISLAILVPTGIALLFLLAQAFQCAGAASSVSTTCVSGSVLALAVVLAVVGILGFVGYIGLVIGIWRLGTRYRETMFHVGAILIIFPFLNIVGLILIWSAARTARAKMASAPPAAPFG